MKTQVHLEHEDRGMSINNTAQKLLNASGANVTLAFSDMWRLPDFPPIADLQAMAKLWLMMRGHLAEFETGRLRVIVGDDAADGADLYNFVRDLKMDWEKFKIETLGEK